jgi:hypothetical protein
LEKELYEPLVKLLKASVNGTPALMPTEKIWPAKVKGEMRKEIKNPRSKTVRILTIWTLRMPY